MSRPRGSMAWTWESDDTEILTAFSQHVETAMVSSSARLSELLPRRRLTIAGSTVYFTRVAMTLNSASSQPLLLQVIFLGGASTVRAQLHAQIT